MSDHSDIKTHPVILLLGMASFVLLLALGAGLYSGTQDGHHAGAAVTSHDS